MADPYFCPISQEGATVTKISIDLLLLHRYEAHWFGIFPKVRSDS